MGRKGRGKGGPKGGSDSWVAGVYERHQERRAGNTGDSFGRWVAAAAERDADARSQLATTADDLGPTVREREYKRDLRAREFQRAAVEYAREILSAKPIRFDGPKGLRVIEGRPVQVGSCQTLAGVSSVQAWSRRARGLRFGEGGSGGKRWGRGAGAGGGCRAFAALVSRRARGLREERRDGATPKPTV